MKLHLLSKYYAVDEGEEKHWIAKEYEIKTFLLGVLPAHQNYSVRATS